MKNRTKKGAPYRYILFAILHRIKQMLKAVSCKFYKVKEGQTAMQIANYFCVSPRVLARENGLKTEPSAGQILKIPSAKGNEYTVKAGDTKALLCGSDKRFESLNGTQAFYIGMSVLI